MPPGRAAPPLTLVRRREDDLALVARCLEGDAAAERELFHREKRRVHATLFRVLGSNRAMEDLVQEVFLEVFRSLARFRGEASLGTWIDRCTAHVALSHLRKRRLKVVELATESAANAPSPEEHALVREAWRRLYAELDRMEPKLRVALALHVLDDRPIAEVARAMDASVVATKTRVWRARRHLEQVARNDPALACFSSRARVAAPASGGEE